MHRRHLCKASLVGVALSLGGCLGRFDGGSSDGVETPEPVTEVGFEFSDGSDERSQDDPMIEVNVEEESATVTGTLRVVQRGDPR
ncbi:hypothetical protein HAPAU_12930 [Halalkalicoccus paucihalophilus]|uniref:Uncharacterized protein n=1 Tax=Halalkalicoccus paucihalophilus TaxID=1008153 RepID=A0A151AES1_9EURY|nr:hypothetical protein [Halalkalicoccus paucihalophilus]KYH26198.1 hypothetical protein HAPAU_12930 [Halalkalicoccus paucihalophilus]